MATSTSRQSPRILNPKFSVNSQLKERVQTLRNDDLKYILRNINQGIQGNKQQLLGRIYAFYEQACEKYVSGELGEQMIAHYFQVMDQAFQLRYRPFPTVANSPAKTSTTNSTATPTPADTNAQIDTTTWETCFAENPFFQKEKTLVSQRLKNLRDNRNRPMLITFSLTSAQLSGYGIQVFCFAQNSNEIKHSWPTNATFDFKVNDRDVRVVKGNPNPGHGKKPTYDQSVDITTFCKVGSNKVEVFTTAFAPYVLVINHMKKNSVDLLIEAVRGRSNTNFETAFAQVKQSFQNKKDDLQEISSKVSLMDPLSRKPLELPARATSCGHLQCFDLRSFLLMNERVPKWKCPHCNKFILFKNIIIDCYFQKILSSVPKEVSEVEILPDATWVNPSPTTPQVAPKKRKVEEPSIILDEDEPSPKVLKTSQENVNRNGGEKKVSSPKPLEENGEAHGSVKQEFPIYPSKSCYVCKSTGNTKRCSKCKSISYCGKDCQFKDWDRHRTECYPVGEREAPSTPPPQRTPSTALPSNPPQNGKSRNASGGSADDAIVID